MTKPRKPQPQLFRSPISLPESRVGKVQIRHDVHPVGSVVPIVGMRQALLRDKRPTGITLDKPLRVHELVEDGRGVWMTDSPEELNQIGEMLENVQPEGRVLVGGLGLGIVATTVAERCGIEKVLVVERSAAVISLCRRPGYDVRRSDIGRFLKDDRRPFDYYLLDTWQGTNEGTWWAEVMPLRRTIRNKFGLLPEIHCWAEDIMWGQIARSLQTQGTLGAPAWYYKYLPCPMTKNEVEAFLNMVGTPWWEKEYGKAVDRYITESRRQEHAAV